MLTIHRHRPTDAHLLLPALQNVRSLHVCLYIEQIGNYITEMPTVEAPLSLFQGLLHVDKILFEWWNAGPLAARRIVGNWHAEFTRVTGVRPTPLLFVGFERGLWEWQAPKGKVFNFQS